MRGSRTRLFGDELWRNRVHSLNTRCVLGSQSSNNASTVASQGCEDLKICLETFRGTENAVSVQKSRM